MNRKIPLVIIIGFCLIFTFSLPVQSSDGDFKTYWSLSGSNDAACDITTDGNYIWTVDKDDLIVYKYEMDGTYIDPPGTFSLTHPGASEGYARGIATDGNFIWIGEPLTAKVYKYTMAGVYTGTSWSLGYVIESMTANATHIWFTNAGDDYVYKYTVDGVFVQSYDYDLPTGAGRVSDGIAFDGTHFWLTYPTIGVGQTRVYKFNTSFSYLSDYWSATGGYPVWELSDQLTTDGDYFWLIANSQHRVYAYETDTTAPTPNPATWSVEPTAVNTMSITMTATTASDGDIPIQYYFDCSPGGNSGWQESSTWLSTGLLLDTEYDFKVKTRDSQSNEGSYSSILSASTKKYIYTLAPTEVSYDSAILWLECYEVVGEVGWYLGNETVSESSHDYSYSLANFSAGAPGTGTYGKTISVNQSTYYHVMAWYIPDSPDYTEGTYVGNFNINSQSNWGYGLDTNGDEIFVCDIGTDEVYNYTMDGTYIDSFDISAKSLNSQGLAANATHIWISDSISDDIYKYTIAGAYVSEFSTLPYASDANGIATNDTHIWVMNTDNDTIFLFQEDGTYVSNFSTAAQSSNMLGLGFDGTYLRTIDVSNDNVYKYTTAGLFVSSFSTTVGSGAGLGCTDDYVWIVDYDANRVYQYLAGDITFYNSSELFFITSPSLPPSNFTASAIGHNWINLTWDNEFFDYTSSNQSTVVHFQSVLGWWIGVYNGTGDYINTSYGLYPDTAANYRAYTYTNDTSDGTNNSLNARSSYDYTSATTLSGFINITIRWENSTYGKIPLDEASRTHHEHIFSVHYGTAFERNYYNDDDEWYITETPSFDDPDITDGNWTIRPLYESPTELRFEWKGDSSWYYFWHTADVCSRTLVMDQFDGDVTFYLRTDLRYVPVFLGGVVDWMNKTSLGGYTYQFIDNHGGFSLTDNPYAYIYTYDNDGSRIIIHSEYLDSSMEIQPSLVFGKTYFLGIKSDSAELTNIGKAPTGTDGHVTIIIPKTMPIDTAIFDHVDISVGRSDTQAYIEFTDITYTTIEAIIDIVHYLNGTQVYTESTNLDTYNFTFTSIDGYDSTLDYAWRLTILLQEEGYFSTGYIPLYATQDYTLTTTDDINIIFELMFGPTPVVTSSGVGVSYAYLCVLIFGVIGLLTFKPDQAHIGLFVEGLIFMLSAGAMAGLNSMFSNYSWQQGVALGGVGFFLLILGIWASLAGKKKEDKA